MSDFVGCAEIVRKQSETLAMFRAAAAAGDWSRIHHAHYDWWMFPIDQPSSYGFAYTVDADAVTELRQTPGFTVDFVDGARILLRSWGWDLDRRESVSNPAPDQCWQAWPIRLEKCGRSLWLFEESAAYASVRDYALRLIAAGTPLQYRGRDCGDFFHTRA